MCRHCGSPRMVQAMATPPPKPSALAADIGICAGCGAAIGAGEPVYDYCNPPHAEIVARVHSENLACLIAWNERWHAAEGHDYDAAFYRR